MQTKTYLQRVKANVNYLVLSVKEQEPLDPEINTSTCWQWLSSGLGEVASIPWILGCSSFLQFFISLTHLIQSIAIQKLLLIYVDSLMVMIITLSC